MIGCLVREAIWVLSCPFWSAVLYVVYCSDADTHHKLLDRVVSGPRFFFHWGCVLSVTLLIVDLWQYYVCCVTSGVTLYVHCIYGALHVPYVPVWVTHGDLAAYLYIVRLLAAEPGSIESFLFPS